jgi:hypothetical protein
MTKRAVCTEIQVRRNIKAALRSGLRIAAIRPDGWIIVRDGDDLIPTPGATQLDDQSCLALPTIGASIYHRCSDGRSRMD